MPKNSCRENKKRKKKKKHGSCKRGKKMEFDWIELVRFVRNDRTRLNDNENEWKKFLKEISNHCKLSCVFICYLSVKLTYNPSSSNQVHTQNKTLPTKFKKKIQHNPSPDVHLHRLNASPCYSCRCAPFSLLGWIIRWIELD